VKQRDTKDTYYEIDEQKLNARILEEHEKGHFEDEQKYQKLLDIIKVKVEGNRNFSKYGRKIKRDSVRVENYDGY